MSCRSPRFQVPVRRPVVGEFLVKEIPALDSVKAEHSGRTLLNVVKSRDMDVDFVLSGISGLFFKHIAVKIMTIEETLQIALDAHKGQKD